MFDSRLSASRSGTHDFSPGDKTALVYRPARSTSAELSHLKSMYETSWKIPITEKQLAGQIANFPEGQIVGTEHHDSMPVSMLNMLFRAINTKKGFDVLHGYDKQSGDRTFSTHTPLSVIRKSIESDPDVIGLALCFSIIVHPEYQGRDYATRTLNHGIASGHQSGLLVVPYSRFSGFAAARERSPHINFYAYSQMTKPNGRPYPEYEAWLRQLAAKGHRLSAPFGGRLPLLTRVSYEYYAGLPSDPPRGDMFESAFGLFLRRPESMRFEQIFEREPTIEDFCVLSGRYPVDPVMRLHILNGAHYVLNDGAPVIFENSRPADRLSDGSNILLTYTPHPFFGQKFIPSGPDSRAEGDELILV